LLNPPLTTTEGREGRNEAQVVVNLSTTCTQFGVSVT
jgi:hypothetical protein